MSDLIERQAAIDGLEKYHEGADLHVDGLTYAYDLICKLPSVSMEKTRWIACSERLPEECEDVLVYIERNAWDEDGFRFKKKCIDIGWHIDGRWHCDGCNGVVGIAWQLLPQPYKEERAGDKK